MTAQAPIYQRMGIVKLRELAATEGEGQDDAARAYVDRLCDMELERRLVLRHNNPGYAPLSIAATVGEPKNGCGYKTDSILQGKDVSTPWHDKACRMMGALPPRHYVAALIRCAKEDHKSQGDWGATYDQIAGNLKHYLRILGFTEYVKQNVKFENGRAIRKSALKARVQMLLLVKSGL